MDYTRESTDPIEEPGLHVKPDEASNRHEVSSPQSEHSATRGSSDFAEEQDPAEEIDNAFDGSEIVNTIHRFTTTSSRRPTYETEGDMHMCTVYRTQDDDIVNGLCDTFKQSMRGDDEQRQLFEKAVQILHFTIALRRRYSYDKIEFITWKATTGKTSQHYLSSRKYG
ncbi:hypothetical protein P171DRAFT_487078 [Karstenula rhodostoma CBS 690.94]|uniref:Uncharacterized protein n=1 Tax=Karstenula rhodostoma CBS 690.94 TaxID=1392251 RepID=A0A9P4UBA4_9PLEO|nr:hypothetical protein P171DRAFT_487078 [Karstenula rhodostoma CBS 690.94]